jgi:hypothetical protein
VLGNGARLPEPLVCPDPSRSPGHLLRDHRTRALQEHPAKQGSAAKALKTLVELERPDRWRTRLTSHGMGWCCSRWAGPALCQNVPREAVAPGCGSQPQHHWCVPAQVAHPRSQEVRGVGQGQPRPPSPPSCVTRPGRPAARKNRPGVACRHAARALAVGTSTPIGGIAADLIHSGSCPPGGPTDRKSQVWLWTPGIGWKRGSAPAQAEQRDWCPRRAGLDGGRA